MPDIPGPISIIPDQVNTANNALNNAMYRQQFSLPSETPQPYGHRAHHLQNPQYSQLEASFQPWSIPSFYTGTLTANSPNSSGSPYQTSPFTASPGPSNPQSTQSTPLDVQFSGSSAEYSPFEGNTYTPRSSASSSKASTPRKDRTPSDGPILVKSDDQTWVL